MCSHFFLTFSQCLFLEVFFSFTTVKILIRNQTEKKSTSRLSERLTLLANNEDPLKPLKVPYYHDIWGISREGRSPQLARAPPPLDGCTRDWCRNSRLDTRIPRISCRSGNWRKSQFAQGPSPPHLLPPAPYLIFLLPLSSVPLPSHPLSSPLLSLTFSKRGEGRHNWLFLLYCRNSIQFHIYIYISF